ncbi:MAG: hypothetical protein KGL91_08760 [Xanthomonadaceae bacterium]|nr:hypothetical protein [Xanthomonadaceae bacterium]
MTNTMLAALRQALLAELPGDGASIGNLRLRERIAARLRVDVAEVDYFAVRDALVQEGLLATGKGRGGSVHRVLAQAAPLVLEAQQKPAGADAPEPRQAAMTLAQARRAKAAVKPARAGGDTEVIAYRHDQGCGACSGHRANGRIRIELSPAGDPYAPSARHHFSVADARSGGISSPRWLWPWYPLRAGAGGRDIERSYPPG